MLVVWWRQAVTWTHVSFPSISEIVWHTPESISQGPVNQNELNHKRLMYIFSLAGTRFRPLSLDVPKPLFPVAGFPMVHHLIEAASKVRDAKLAIAGNKINNFIIFIGCAFCLMRYESWLTGILFCLTLVLHKVFSSDILSGLKFLLLPTLSCFHPTYWNVRCYCLPLLLQLGGVSI